MTIAGQCRHRYAHDRYCGLTVMATPFGLGHASRPAAHHYPVVRSSESASASEGFPRSSDAVAAAGTSIGHPGGRGTSRR